MAIHSSTLAWRIPWTEEPGRPQSVGSKSQTWLSNWHTHKIEQILDGTSVYFIYSPISRRKQDEAGRTQDGVSRIWEAGWLSPHSLHPSWKSWTLSACNSWPWANERLSCLLAKKKIPQVEGWGRGGDLVYPSLHCSFLWIFFTLQQAGDNMPPATAAAQPHQGFFDLRAPNTRTRNRFPWDWPRSRGHCWIKQQRREGWRLLKMRLQWRPHLRDRGDGFNRRTVS